MKKVIMVIIFAIAGLGLGILLFFLSDDNKIFYGVRIDGLKLGGCTALEVHRLLNAYLRLGTFNRMVLKYDTQTRTVSFEDLGVKIAADKMVVKSFEVGRVGRFWARIWARLMTLINEKVLGLEFAMDTAKTKAHLKRLARQIERQPKNADLRVLNSKFEIVPEQVGIKLDLKRSFNNIQAAFAQNAFQMIQLAVQRVQPAVKSTDLRDINAQLASYTTKFNPWQKNRNHNIRQIAKILDGTLIKAGEVFSYNEVVGPRSQKLGFRVAPVMIHGELVPGTGGGACQVSTTLYNVALLANFKIIARSHHSRPITYVPLGQDATVVYGKIDLKFKNTLPKPVLLKASTSKSTLGISAYGTKPENNPQVKIISQHRGSIPFKVVTREEPTLPVGKKRVLEKGKKGYKVTVIRVAKDNTGKSYSEVISNDLYRPHNAVVVVGTRPALKVSEEMEDVLPLKPVRPAN